MANTTSNDRSTNLERVPSAWPGGFGLYKYSKQAVSPNVAVLVGVNALAIPFSLMSDRVFSRNSPGSFMLSLIGWLVSTLVAGATVYIWLRAIEGKRVGFEEALRKGLDYFWDIFLSTLLVMAAALVSLLLLVIPVFFVLPRLAFVQLFVVDKNMSPVDAFKASWEHSRGHVSKVYTVFGVNIAIALLMLTIIGIPFSIYFLIMYSAAYALLYKFIGQKA